MLEHLDITKADKALIKEEMQVVSEQHGAGGVGCLSSFPEDL